MAFMVAMPILAAVIGAVSLMSGFGLGTVLMPFFALTLPIEIAITATAVVHLTNNIFKVALVGRHADPGVFVRFGVPAVIAAICGAAVLAMIAPAEPWARWRLGGAEGYEAVVTPAKVVTALLLATFATLELLPRFQSLRMPLRAMPLGGALSGFFGGLTGMQGALRAPFLLRAGLTKDQFVGTTCVVSTAVDLARLLAYAVGLTWLSRAHDHAPLAEPSTLTLVILTALGGCIGSLLGRTLLSHITLRGVRITVAVMLYVLAVALGCGLA
jgi:uncharacterized membrane protein YfcA